MTADTAVVTAPTYLFEEPDVASHVLMKLRIYDVTVLASRSTHDGWLHVVDNASRREGWVLAKRMAVHYARRNNPAVGHGAGTRLSSSEKFKLLALAAHVNHDSSELNARRQTLLEWKSTLAQQADRLADERSSIDDSKASLDNTDTDAVDSVNRAVDHYNTNHDIYKRNLERYNDEVVKFNARLHALGEQKRQLELAVQH